MALDAPDLPSVITRDTVRKATNRVKHNVRIDDIRKLPESLANPVMVFESKSEAGALVVLTEFEDASGRPVMAAVHLNQKEGRLEGNRIASVYGRERESDFMDWVAQGLLRYRHTAKSALGYNTGGSNCPKVVHPRKACRTV